MAFISYKNQETLVTNPAIDDMNEASSLTFPQYLTHKTPAASKFDAYQDDPSSSVPFDTNSSTFHAPYAMPWFFGKSIPNHWLDATYNPGPTQNGNTDRVNNSQLSGINRPVDRPEAAVQHPFSERAETSQAK